MFVFEWFSLAFGDPKEQARLFMVLISTFLAITILLLNQWFIDRRANKERLIVKLEELTTAVHRLASSGHLATNALLIQKINADENIRIYQECISEIKTLCSLFFKDHSIFDNSLIDALDLIKVARNSLIDKNRPTDKFDEVEIYSEIHDKLNFWYNKAHTKLDELTTKHIK